MTNEYLKIVENAIEYHKKQGHLRIVEVLKGVRTRMKQVDALDRMAENARELGLDYDTVGQQQLNALKQASHATMEKVKDKLAEELHKEYGGK